MIGVDLLNKHWGDGVDWDALAHKAVLAGVSMSSHSRLRDTDFEASISISLSSNEEVQTLNAQWRGNDKPTNVLSFPMLDADELGALTKREPREILLGDIILAHGVCITEAEEKSITLAQHATHLIIHGTLHLLGYDHIDDTDAEHMEGLEVKALASLGLGNPYSDH
jgi:probable rRNA maturation factor